MTTFIGFLGLYVGFLFFRLGIYILCRRLAYKRCSKYLRAHGIDSGPFVQHGMVIDLKTGLVHGTSTPSSWGIDTFMR